MTDPSLKLVLDAYNAAPYVTVWLDTLFGQNVGNALNVAVVNLMAGQGDAAGHRHRGQRRGRQVLGSTSMTSISENLRTAQAPRVDLGGEGTARSRRPLPAVGDLEAAAGASASRSPPGGPRARGLRGVRDPARSGWPRTTASSAGPGTARRRSSSGCATTSRSCTTAPFLEALRHNAIIAVLSLVIQGPIAIGLALLLNRKMRGQSVLRVLIFVPYVISEVVVGLGWSLMLQSTGAANGLLENIGLGAWKQDWLSDPTSRSGPSC